MLASSVQRTQPHIFRVILVDEDKFTVGFVLTNVYLQPPLGRYVVDKNESRREIDVWAYEPRFSVYC